MESKERVRKSHEAASAAAWREERIGRQRRAAAAAAVAEVETQAEAAAAARAAAPAASLAGYRQQLAADGVKRHLTSVRIKRDESVEALEVLSSQFFSRAR